MSPRSYRERNILFRAPDGSANAPGHSWSLEGDLAQRAARRVLGPARETYPVRKYFLHRRQHASGVVFVMRLPGSFSAATRTILLPGACPRRISLPALPHPAWAVKINAGIPPEGDKELEGDDAPSRSTTTRSRRRSAPTFLRSRGDPHDHRETSTTIAKNARPGFPDSCTTTSAAAPSRRTRYARILPSYRRRYCANA
jgi:hypothetical protein